MTGRVEPIRLSPGRVGDSRDMPNQTTQRPPARDALILDNMDFVRALARRYSDRGEPVEDLVQVGMIGLINAADRFDETRGSDFRSFAAPTVLGEIRRHFRDRAWAVRVPRQLKDDTVRISALVERISSDRGRTPTVPEIAEASGLTVDRVLDAFAANSAYRPDSLSRSPWLDDDDQTRDLPQAETGYRETEDRMMLGDALRVLPARERIILHLRFEEGLLQSQIAERVGISQMHVSRLITRALARLREVIEDPG
jgi:RNA polymerase sigma-B factor